MRLIDSMALSLSGLIQHKPPIFYIPLTIAEDDSNYIVIENTRIGLEIIVDAYNRGWTAEEITYNYDTLMLDQVHSVIAYYLQNKPSVDEYVNDLYEQADVARIEIEGEHRLQEFRRKLESRLLDAL